MEAMEKLKAGVRFNEVATQYSEDKARQGVRSCIIDKKHIYPLNLLKGNTVLGDQIILTVSPSFTETSVTNIICKNDCRIRIAFSVSEPTMIVNNGHIVNIILTNYIVNFKPRETTMVHNPNRHCDNQNMFC